MKLRALRRLARRSKQPVRVGICRIAHETNAWNPVPSEPEDFERAHFLTGSDLLAACEKKGVEVEGYVANAELSGALRGVREAGAEAVGLMSAWAIPSGPISDTLLERFHAWLGDALDAAGPLDAVVVAMHGAMTSVQDHLPEAALLQQIRTHVGPDVPVVLTLDLHAHLTPPKLAPVDAVLAYQTNPHRDHARVGHKAGLLAVAMARGTVRVRQAWRMLPMIFGGGTTLDFLPTMRPVFRAMNKADRHPAVVHASLFMSHLWHDAPDLGWSTLVLTDADADPEGTLAASQADALADALWSVRDVHPPAFASPAEAIALARDATWSRRTGVVAFSDASDNIAAGGHGGNTHLLQALLAHGHGLVSLVPVKAPNAVASLRNAQPGDAVDTVVGTWLDAVPDVPVQGTLLSRHHHDAFGEMLVIDAGHVKLVISEGPPLAMKPSFYGDLGLDPWRADIVVAKSLFHFRWYFLPMARRVVYVKSRGNTDLELPLEQTFELPVYPHDDLADWRAEDRRRRGPTE